MAVREAEPVSSLQEVKEVGLDREDHTEGVTVDPASLPEPTGMGCGDEIDRPNTTECLSSSPVMIEGPFTLSGIALS